MVFRRGTCLRNASLARHERLRASVCHTPTPKTSLSSSPRFGCSRALAHVGPRDRLSSPLREGSITASSKFMNMLQRMSLTGFKSIREMRDLEFRRLNVLIGANGAGKSNLISFFKLLNFAMTNPLKPYVAAAGYANSLLHFGSQQTKEISASLEFVMDGGTSIYELKLLRTAEDSLIFNHEAVTLRRVGHANLERAVLGSGLERSLLEDPRGNCANAPA